MGEDKIVVPLHKNRSLAVIFGTAKPADFTKVIVDSVVAEKNIAFPADAKFIHKAQVWLVKETKRYDIKLRQSYKRVGKWALIKHQRYAHTRHYERTIKALHKLKTYLGRTCRDIKRQINGNGELENAFSALLYQADRVMTQKLRDSGRHTYALHAPEVECNGKGKSHKPYDFGVKVSIATTLNRCKGGQYAVPAKTPPGKPYDGRTLETVILDIEKTTGATLQRILADDGYTGHNAPGIYKLRTFTASHIRWVTPQIKREKRRRLAVVPFIEHIKDRHRMNRNFLAHNKATPSTRSLPQEASTSASFSSGSHFCGSKYTV